MSLLKKIADIGRAVLRSPVAKLIPGPVGVAANIYGTYQGIKSMTGTMNLPTLPATPRGPGMTSLSLPTIGRIGGVVAAGGRAVMSGARRIYQAAASYCRKHPAWCQTIGGIAAVEAMIERGELPVPKRRRGRGITATELRHFKRVARFTSKYCAPVHRAMRAPAMRRSRSSCQ